MFISDILSHLYFHIATSNNALFEALNYYKSGLFPEIM